jgi:hydrogenase-4 component F
MRVLLILLCALPLAPAALTLAGGVALRVTQGATALVGAGCFGMSVALVGTAAHGEVAIGFLRADAISVVFLLAIAFLYATVSMYAIGYLRESEGTEGYGRYARRFYFGLNLFAAAMLWAPLVDGLALLWIAIEITTVVSALLVAIENTDTAAEAAWKYLLIASAGLGVALLATIFLYYAGASVLGQSYDLAFTPLLHAGARLPHTAVRLAFVLAVLGFGTKVGLFPVHTWLPDAHSEAPTPVSALLSGALLATSFYAILRFYQVTAATLGSAFPRNVLLVFGVASLLLAALYVLDQQDLKRLLAYSSVEHMGILALGVAFGAPVALAGVLLHVLAHAAAKGNAFMGAGVFVRAFHTKQIASMRGALTRLPWSGPLFLCAILALSAMPPFGLFRSEFQIVQGGLGAGRFAGAAILVALVTLAFLGLAVAATRMVLTPAREAPGTARLRGPEPSAWMVAPALIGLAALVLLGVHPPADLTALLAHGAALLGGAS